uniref:Dual specificity phosphatase 19a n=1 Tax=Lepisosteus oculatus TaxID=7918 RepID=W5MHX8_LEPOC
VLKYYMLPKRYSALKKQCTRVTTLTGKRIIETWKDSTVQVVEETVQPEGACGYVQDLSLDLQVGIVKPWLLLGETNSFALSNVIQTDVTHILNVAYGVENTFQDQFVYKQLSILDLPETVITSYFQECSEFIEQVKAQNGVVLVHCNAGVSRSASIVIGYLMSTEGLRFDDAFALVKNARPAICPNLGFMEQLRNYKLCSEIQFNGVTNT